MKPLIREYVCEVKDFSSQYGSIDSISYSADNICGRISRYPEYGDFPSSYSMQTYGKWWKRSHSSITEVFNVCSNVPVAMDFIDLKFKYTVNPSQVNIYEVFNPGSVIRVWGSYNGQCFCLLWAGSMDQEMKPRVYSLTVTRKIIPVNLLRIEFNQRQQLYYCGFEAVLLIGTLTIPYSLSDQKVSDLIKENIIQLDSLKFCEESIRESLNHLIKYPETIDINSLNLCSEDEDDNLKLGHSLDKVDEKNVSNLSFENLSTFENQDAIAGGFFSTLPEELNLCILSKLDFQSQCRLSCTCKMMQYYVLNPFLYQSVNFKNYWWLVNGKSLQWITLRSSQLKQLDLSWCGNYGRIQSDDFMEFINQGGHKLSVLLLNNCHFVDSYCLYIIANTCCELEVLSLSACDKIDHLGFLEIKKLKKLTHLTLTRTKIDCDVLQILLQSVNQLRHLIISHCVSLDLDKVCQTVSTFNRNLESLVAWKTRGLTARGLKSLSSLTTVVEVDFGWSFDRAPGSITESLNEFLHNNRNIKKLFLTASRILSDEDVDLIAFYAANLEQLDLMGSRNISPQAIWRLLSSCEKLQLLDVSYCDQIHANFVQQCSVQFPNVSIKCVMKSAEAM